MAGISVKQINTELEPFGWKCISSHYENLNSEM